MQDGIDGSAEIKALREIIYLARFSRTAVLNILAFGWIEDGVDAREANAIDFVVGFNDAANALTITELAWVQDGIEDLELKAIRQLTSIAATDANEAARVMALPSIQDGIDIGDVSAIADGPSPITDATPKVIVSVIGPGSEQAAVSFRDKDSHSEAAWVELMADGTATYKLPPGVYTVYVYVGAVTESGGTDWGMSVSTIHDVEFDGTADMHLEINLGDTSTPAVPDLSSTYDTKNTRWLERNHPALAGQIQDFAWVQDGLSDLERSTIDELIYMAVEDVANLEAALQLPWVQDAISEAEYEFLDFLGVLDTQDPAYLLAALNLPSVQGAAVSTYVTNNVRWLARNYPALFLEIQALPWMQDGLSDLERSAVDELLYMAVGDVANLETALQLRWVQDAISEAEYEALDKLGFLDTPNPANLYAALNTSWVQDDISATEYDIIDALGALDFDAPDIVFQLFSMPFLLSPDTTDALAILGMEELADGGRLAALTDHATFQDGITDDETTLIAAVGTLDSAPDEIRRVLEPRGAAIETAQLGTNLTPGLKISIVRTGSQSNPDTIEATRDWIEFVEDTMGLPLPVDHVIIVLNEEAVPDGAAGANYGFAFSYLPKYEMEQGTPEWRGLQQGFVHEAAHYYWRGNDDWVDEGLANIFEYMYGLENGLSRGQLQPLRDRCEAHDLEMLTELGPDREQDFGQFHCNYYLGQLLFQDLLESVGDEEFVEKIRELYRSSTQLSWSQLPDIDQIRQVFPDQAEIIDHHWSGKLNAPENRGFDEGIDRTSHNLIQWDQYPTYSEGEVTLKGTPLGDAVYMAEDMRAIIDYGYAAFGLYTADDWKYLGSILPYEIVTGRQWKFDDPGDVQASTFVIFRADKRFHIVFPFPTAIGNPEDVVIVIWGFQNADREPTIGSVADLLGYARIRVEQE